MFGIINPCNFKVDSTVRNEWNQSITQSVFKCIVYCMDRGSSALARLYDVLACSLQGTDSIRRSSIIIDRGRKRAKKELFPIKKRGRERREEARISYFSPLSLRYHFFKVTVVQTTSKRWYTFNMEHGIILLPLFTMSIG